MRKYSYMKFFSQCLKTKYLNKNDHFSFCYLGDVKYEVLIIRFEMNYK